MEADRSGGGPNPNSGGGGGGGSGNSGAGRNPNGPKTASGHTTSGTGIGPMAAAAGAGPGSFLPREAQDGDSGMTLPGILHFIQYEWGRFQAEKYRWEAERDELRADDYLIFKHFSCGCSVVVRGHLWCPVSTDRPTINVFLPLNQVGRLRSNVGQRQKGQKVVCFRAQVAFLQGERKGQENMKQDLVRRIKMLEYALKQERAKHQKLKSGNDQSPGDKKPEMDADQRMFLTSSNLVSYLDALHDLRYLEEVGYSDTILDMRSKRVRSLLGRSSPEANGPPPGES
ncbi:hypothetical protein GOODEAATRI_012033, partial [Goodea atripinnis]